MNAPTAQPMSFPRRVTVAGGILAALVLLFVFMWYAAYVLLLAFAGVLVAVLLHSLAEGIAYLTKLSIRWSLLIGLAMIVLFFVGAGFFIAPAIANQVDQLSEQLPEAVRSVAERLERYRWGRWLLEHRPDSESMAPGGSDMIWRAMGLVSTTFGAVVSVVVVMFVGLYLAFDPVLYTSGILRLVPPRRRPRAAEVLAALGYTLRWWLIGQLLTMTVVGVMTAIGLWLLGIPLALTLGLLAFLLDFVPNFGPIAAAAPGVLLALAISPTKALYVTILYVVVQQIEGLLITPLIHQRTVKIPPALTILTQVLLGVLVGPLGLLLATPLLAVVLVLVKLLYVEETLGDEMDTPDDHLKKKDEPPIPPTTPTTDAKS